MTVRAGAVPRMLLGALLAIGAAGAHSRPAANPATAPAADAGAEEARRLNDEALRLYAAGRYDDALPLAQRALEIRERVLGRDHPDTLAAVGNAGVLYRLLGRYAEAEPLYRRALEGYERIFGRDHRYTLTAVDNLAALLSTQGHYAEAEPFSRRAVEGFERVLGRDDPDTLAAIANLAELYHHLGRYAEAEPLFRRALEGRNRVLGRDHPDTLASANNLALFYRDTGRYADAEPLFRRALDGRERILGRDHPDTLATAGNLAVLYRILGRSAEAEPLYQRAFQGRERAFGRDHPSTLVSLNNLAEFYRVQGRTSDAEPLLRRALEGSERVLGRDHPYTLYPLQNLAILYSQDGRYAEAEPLFERALETSERVLGRDNPGALGAAAWLVTNQLRTPGRAGALAPARLLIEGARQRRAAGVTDQQFRAQRERETATSAGYFTLFADAAWSSASAHEGALRGEAFAALQEAMTGAADRAIAQQAAQRYADGRSPALLALIRERQQQEEEWSRLDAQLTQALEEAPNSASAPPGELRRRLEQIQGRIETIDARLKRDAPDYFQLVQPQPLSVEAASALLHEDEAILLVEPGEFGTHVMVVTRAGVEWQRSDWNLRLVRRKVQKLRWDAGATVSGSEEELARLRRERPDGGREAFDRSTAYELYRELVAPVLPLLAGKQRIYVAAGGALAGLPFSILVSAPPTGTDDDPAALRATHWFGDDFALVHIPSIQSLALLRQAPPPPSAGGFLGIGDPVLAGHGTVRGRGVARGLPATQQRFRPGEARGGLLADVGALRQMPSLPGTARELESVRLTLGAPASSLLLAASATEPKVRSANLAADRIILFSTHGLTAAEAPGVGEAGLVLTPPAEAREGDDGFLSASEVTALRLKADWVILSACNTATGDGAENAGLGQLARAFFYAGARNLLASHWPVSDEVAPVLITRTLALERAGAPRAEALRQAMREIRMDGSHDSATDSWAHPFYWAPFVLIGDGGR